jgi:hypothetical protein
VEETHWAFTRSFPERSIESLQARYCTKLKDRDAGSDGKKDWFIPSGTPVGMTSVLVHHNESISRTLRNSVLNDGSGIRILIGICFRFTQSSPLTLCICFISYGYGLMLRLKRIRRTEARNHF